MASRQRCETSHCSGPVKNSKNENEILLIFSTNHLLLQKFLEDRLCLKDALAVLLKTEERHLHIENDPRKKQEIYCNRMLPNQPPKCQNVAKVNENCAKTKWFITHLHMSCHNLAEEGKLLRRERDHLIVFEN